LFFSRGLLALVVSVPRADAIIIDDVLDVTGERHGFFQSRVTSEGRAGCGSIHRGMHLT